MTGYAPDWHRIETYELASGTRWRVEYINPATGKKTRRSGFKRKGDAARWWAGRHRDTARGDMTSETQRRTTIADVYTTHVEPTITRPAYRSAWRIHVRGRWGHHRVGAVSSADIRTWDAEMRQDGVSYASRRGAEALLSRILASAVEAGLLQSNPAHGLRLDTSDKPRARQRHLTAAQATTLIEAGGTLWGPLLRFLITTGTRIGEAASLTCGDVAPDGKTVHIRITKTDRPRHVPITEQLQDLIRRRVDAASADAPLWPSPRGAFLDPDNWRSRQWKAIVAAAREVDDSLPATLTPHDLRHTAASLAIAHGADLKTLQTMLGHATATMTLDTYGHLMPGRTEAVAAAIGDALG